MSRLSALTEVTVVTTDDLFHIADAPGGLNDDKKITAANLRKFMSSVYNVKDYGAVGDGITNDRSAIQAAIDAAGAAGGGIVFFPTGIYRISSLLSVVSDNVYLRGVGASSIIQSTSNTMDVVVFGDGITTCSNVGISDLLLNNSSGVKTGGTGVKLNKCFKVWIERMQVTQQYRAIHVLNTTQLYFNNNDVRNTKENGIVFEATLSNGYEWYLNNNVFDNPDVSNIGIGLAWYGGESLIVSGLDCLRFNLGMEVNPPASCECRFGFLTNALFDTSIDNGIHITNTGSGNTVALTFTNCWIGTSGNYGLLMERQGGGIVQGVRWVGGKVFHNGLAGFRMAGGQDLHISDCDIIGNSQTVSASRHGVEIGGAYTNWSVMNCRIGGGYGQGNTQGYAISVDAGAADYYRIIGNDTSTGNNNTPTINDGGTGSHKVVANNL